MNAAGIRAGSISDEEIVSSLNINKSCEQKKNFFMIKKIVSSLYLEN